MNQAESWESNLRAERMAGVKLQRKTRSWSTGGGVQGTDRRPVLLVHEQWGRQYGVGLAGSSLIGCSEASNLDFSSRIVGSPQGKVFQPFNVSEQVGMWIIALE